MGLENNTKLGTVTQNNLGKEVPRETQSEELGVHNKKSTSSKKEVEEFKNKKPLGERILNYTKAILLASLLLAIGGPIGIGLGLIIFVFAGRKPIVGTIKKNANFIKKVAKGETSISEKIKSFFKKKTKKENNLENPENNLRRVRGTSTSLEMDKESLRKMETRPDGVSVTELPDHQSKATSNDLKLAGLKFEKLTKSSVKLSEKALERRNTFPSRKNTLPNIKTPKPAFKL